MCKVIPGRMKSMNKNTLVQASLATFEDHRKSVTVSGTKEWRRGREKRKRRLDLLATISMRGMLRGLDLFFHPNRRPLKL